MAHIKGPHFSNCPNPKPNARNAKVSLTGGMATVGDFL